MLKCKIPFLFIATLLLDMLYDLINCFDFLCPFPEIYIYKSFYQNIFSFLILFKINFIRVSISANGTS